MKTLIGVSALIVASLLLAFSLLAVFPAPTYNLWKLRILVTECGHFIAPICLLTPLVWRRSRLSRVASVIAVIAACLLLVPMMSSLRILRSFPEPRPSVPRFMWSMYFGHESVVPPTFRTMAARNGAPLTFAYYAVGGPVARVHAPPLVVMIHGGSWQSGSPSQLAPLTYHLTREGYAVASVTYRFAPHDTFPAQIEDVSDEIAYLRTRAAELGFDSSRITVLGRSAGGQLALLYAYTKHDHVTGVISFYGPTDLTWDWGHPSRPRVHNSRRFLREYVGGPLDTHVAAYTSASPIAFAAHSSVPTLLVHGGSDDLVSVMNSRRLATVLLNAKHPATLVELPWATHGCDYIVRGPCYRISTLAVERFLREVMPP